MRSTNCAYATTSAAISNRSAARAMASKRSKSCSRLPVHYINVGVNARNVLRGAEKVDSTHPRLACVLVSDPADILSRAAVGRSRDELLVLASSSSALADSSREAQ